jgi:hypothetical protein
MPELKLQDTAPFAGHSPQQHRPLGSYGVLSGAFFAACLAFAAWLRRSDHELPERPAPADLALITVATHKASRLIAKDRVTSVVRAPFTRFEDDATAGEVSESARGTGMRRAIGELLLCPYCLGLWVAAALTAGLVVAPRPTRWAASVLSALFGADMLQIAYKKAEDAL